MLGAGWLSAITGGVGRGRAAAVGGRDWSVGAGCDCSRAEGGSVGGGLGGGARFTVNEPIASPRSGASSDGRRIRGSHVHITAT
jgi:hypothetical protein